MYVCCYCIDFESRLFSYNIINKHETNMKKGNVNLKYYKRLIARAKKMIIVLFKCYEYMGRLFSAFMF